jgi:WD40 repeat protein
LGRGRHLVTSSEDGTAKLWDVSTQKALHTYPPFQDDVMPSKLHDALLMDPTAHPIKLSDTAPSSGAHVAEAQGNLLLTGGSDGVVRGYDLRAQGQVMMLPSGGRAGGIEALCIGPTPFSFTLGTTEGPIAMVDLRNKQSVHCLGCPMSQALPFAVFG